jgi:hypothetical protein
MKRKRVDSFCKTECKKRKFTPRNELEKKSYKRKRDSKDRKKNRKRRKLVCPPKLLNDITYQIGEYKKERRYKFELLKYKRRVEHFMNLTNNWKFYCNTNNFLKFVHFSNKS